MQQVKESAFLQPFDQILKRIFSIPVMALVVGDWKTGKTDFALLIAERLLELGIVKKVASNIETKDPRIEFVSSLEKLKHWLYMDKMRKLYILDEAGVHVPRRTPMKEKNVKAIQLLPEISKAHAKLIIVTQDPDGIDSQFLNPVWLKAMFVKDSLKNARLISDFFETVISIRDIPPTTIKFDPYAIAPFTLTEPLRMPAWILKDEQYKLLWQWAIEGKSFKTLGIHPMQLNRIVRKFIANILKSSDTSLFTQQREVT
jgi:hypothetical protein